jgi:TolB protein
LPAQAAFPGQNGRIAFVTARDGNDEVYSMNADGTSPTRLTNDPAADTQPAWSPDGRRIAFVSFRDGNGEIYVMNADGTGQTRITNTAAGESSPTWSPDRKKIAFYSGDAPCSIDSCNFEIYSMNADGTGVTQLTNNTVFDGHPRWSPDGTRIAFDRFADRRASDGTLRTDYDLYTMNADGSNQVSLLSSENDRIRLGDWSPDSTKIVFEWHDAIYSIGSTGGQPGLVAACFVNIGCGGDTGLLSVPVFSPDGAEVAFSHRDCIFVRGGFCDPPFIQTMKADGTEATALPGPADLANWQSIVGPKRSDYKNAAAFCKAERDFLGEGAFAQKYGTNGNGANAYGKCVSQNN